MSEVFKMIPAPDKTLWSFGIFALLITALLCLTGYMAYSSRHMQLELSDSQLHIRGNFYGRRIPITSLVADQALLLELNRNSPYRPTLRMNGIGLPGYQSGWFKLKNGNKALLFVTDFQRVVYLPTTDGYSLLLSVKEPERFLQSIKDSRV